MSSLGITGGLRILTRRILARLITGTAVPFDRRGTLFLCGSPRGNELLGYWAVVVTGFFILKPGLSPLPGTRQWLASYCAYAAAILGATLPICEAAMVVLPSCLKVHALSLHRPNAKKSMHAPAGPSLT